jgi:23S rRNA (cytosine1962-C5)-methyltransferase
MIKIKLKKGKEAPVLGGHPWIFSGAIERMPEEVRPGEPVEVYGGADQYLASGYFNSYSQIAVRVWGYKSNETIDQQFFSDRIACANYLRQKFIDQRATDSYRLVNSENDYLPGLIVDKYADYLVVQFHTRGIERWQKEIVEALVKEVKPKGIYERSDSLSRKKEEMAAQNKCLYREAPDSVVIKENGLKFLVDIMGGQKTGFFLDQREKRQALLKYAKDKDVLNCFAYSGGFSVYALAGGANTAVNVDVSGSALEIAKENMKLNGFDPKKCRFVEADAKKFLEEVRPGEYGIIILDPPAFIKDRRKIKEGISGYRRINRQGMAVLSKNGILVSCSCSSHLSSLDFRRLLVEAGANAGKSVRILESYSHGPDHPTLLPFTESEYLKCLFMIV